MQVALRHSSRTAVVTAALLAKGHKLPFCKHCCFEQPRLGHRPLGQLTQICQRANKSFHVSGLAPKEQKQARSSKSYSPCKTGTSRWIWQEVLATLPNAGVLHANSLLKLEAERLYKKPRPCSSPRKPTAQSLESGELWKSHLKTFSIDEQSHRQGLDRHQWHFYLHML